MPLERLGSPPGISFFRCPACERQFTLMPGKALVERWLGPLSLVLYDVIFEERPQDRAEEMGRRIFQGRMSAFPYEALGRLLEEIRIELSAPSQVVRDILDCRASEEDLREYLRRLADEIERRLETSRGPRP